MKLLDKIFGSAGEKELKKIQVVVDQVNALEEKMKGLKDEDFPKKTEEFKKKISAVIKYKDDQERLLLNDEEKEAEKKVIENVLEEIVPEALALIREAGWRVIKERAYDVQVVGAMALHQGKIAEMKTGEGKTLASVLAAYLNALSGRGVHIVTVNDYLSKRDANWMGAIFDFTGLTVACLNHDVSYKYSPVKVDEDEVTVEMENLKAVERREAYECDVLYGTNNEFGFDYLRDNMAPSADRVVQRPLNYAIVDEVDSILIDEARTPLIISAPDDESGAMYQQFASIVPRLVEDEDYNVDEKLKSVTLTQEGIDNVEKTLGIGNIYEAGKISYVHHLEQALKARVLFQKDKDYVVKDNEIVIVDEFTGRMMPGRRYSEGLHQALEAKEGVQVQRESRTLATITFQNYFRIYSKLAGMTGTALSSAEELHKVYKLEVLEIPTNRPMARKDKRDVVYKNEKGKMDAIVEHIKELHKQGRPILVGTIAIEKSEQLSALLERSGIEHEVLNAKNHEREAQIIANAGHYGSVTIATNMAGRGTDIKLDEKAKEAGGLAIIGSERHEARRIDEQLRGRAGRQGDPGSSQFFVSLEDELMRRFGGDKMRNIMEKLGLPDDQPIENKMISKSIESAQGKIEGFNFDMRKRVLEYDDVMNKQRETIYKHRLSILRKEDISDEIEQLFEEDTASLAQALTAGDDEDKWDTKELAEELSAVTGEDKKVAEEKLDKLVKIDKSTKEKREEIEKFLYNSIKGSYEQKEEETGKEALQGVIKNIYLKTIDNFWMDHLEHMDHIREGIGFQGYAQQDPLIAYKKEAFGVFQALLGNINRSVVTAIFKVNVVSSSEAVSSQGEGQFNVDNLNYSGGQEPTGFNVLNAEQINSLAEGGQTNQSSAGQEKEAAKPIVNKNKEVGRNDKCPCGSGKKYKKCCGR
jgi:preprotein translocase subunit SecA